ncbi:hypothetical protein QUF79_03345 [Fictibacillus enclensis]|uniref:hypothetical protein n=1 Tax=Fictibacillus enclensis TaxID=1017270 RepID=UPI0025A13AF8|nr:hypothetical protein [Fictibacillus enclensis]MDM5197068.1 hypothetical protein [Fictibacillus enclensis]
MSKKAKYGFILFNILYFSFNWLLIPYMPNWTLFGWMPFQMFLLFATPVAAALIWALYYNAFFNTQTHVDVSTNQEREEEVI